MVRLPLKLVDFKKAAPTPMSNQPKNILCHMGLTLCHPVCADAEQMLKKIFREMFSAGREY